MKTIYYFNDKYQSFANIHPSYPFYNEKEKILNFNSKFINEEFHGNSSEQINKLLKLLRISSESKNSSDYFTIPDKEIRRVCFCCTYTLLEQFRIGIFINKYKCEIDNEDYVFLFSELEYHNEEYTYEKFLSNGNLYSSNWDRIFDKEKIYNKPKFSNYFTRYDKMKSTHELDKNIYVPGFDISVIDESEYVQWLGLEKKSLLSTTYSVKKK